MWKPSHCGISRRIAVGFAGLLITLASIRTAGESPATKPVLVELFTSEGCSSCPPADALLRNLDSTQPVPGVQLIVLGEHVDYWDDLGWRDKYSSHAFTVRQQAYTDRLHLASPYTPEMFADGSLEFLGSDPDRASQAIAKASALPKIAVRLSEVKIENGKLHAHVEADPSSGSADVFLALALDHAQSQVLRGENGGHQLEHVAVVRNLVRIGKAKKGEGFSQDVTVNADSASGPYRVVAFLQEANQGRVIGAAMQNLAP